MTTSTSHPVAGSGSANPEVANSVTVAGLAVNYHDVGQGKPLLLIHGSGPGVSAWANWRLALPQLALHHRVVAPDMMGFGFSERPADQRYSLKRWLEQVLGFLDALGIDKTDVVGNSFGGGLALAMAIAAPQRVRRLVLMGSVGVPFTITPALDAVWGYTPSQANMAALMDLFAYDRSRINPDLIEARYQASIRPGFQESFAAMFPAPRQRWVDALASQEEAIRRLPHHTLVLHGREDQVIPLSNSLTLMQWIPRCQLHVFGQCGHWTQIEHAARFSQLVHHFCEEGGDAEPLAL